MLSPHFICLLFSLSPFQQRCRFSTTNFKLYCPLHYAEFIDNGNNWNDPGNSVFYNENYILGKLTGHYSLAKHAWIHTIAVFTTTHALTYQKHN